MCRVSKLAGVDTYYLLTNITFRTFHQEPVWIITELMVNGSLQDYLHKRGNSLIRDGNMTVLITMAGQCASGMAYLEAEVGCFVLFFVLLVQCMYVECTFYVCFVY